MTVTYQVGDGGHLDIDFWVGTFLCQYVVLSHNTIQLSDPIGKVLGKQIRQSTGQIAITAQTDGRHEYCFSNQMSAIADKTVRCVQLFPVFPTPNPSNSFNVHGVIYVSGDGLSCVLSRCNGY